MSSHVYDMFMNEPTRFSSPSGVNNTHPRFGFRNSQFDPTLLLVERLIGDDRESELVRVKIERAILIAHGNADEFDLFDHDALKVSGLRFCRPELPMIHCKKSLSV